MVNEVPVHYLLWAIGTAFVAKNLAASYKRSKKQVDYVYQLVERGYTQAEAASAWEIASNGGFNLLFNLQQTDTIAKTDQRGDKHNDSNAD